MRLVIVCLWFVSASAVVLRGRFPSSLPLKNMSTPQPMNRIKESSLAQLGVQLPIFQRSYSVDNTTVLLPLSIASSLANISRDDEIGIFFGRWVKNMTLQSTEILLEGVCEFEFPKSIREFEILVNHTIPSLSQISSLEPVGCFFPNPSARVSASEVAAGMILSGTSSHPTEFLLVRHEQPPSTLPLRSNANRRRLSHPTEPPPGLSVLRIHPLAFSLQAQGLLDLKGLVESREPQSSLRTSQEVSINDGEPLRELDSVLLTIPTAVSQPYRSDSLFLPCHIFPPPHRINGSSTSLSRTAEEYLSHLLALSLRQGQQFSLEEGELELGQWFDLNLLLKLLEEVDKTLLRRLVDLLRRDARHGNKSDRSAEFRFLIASLRAYFP